MYFVFLQIHKVNNNNKASRVLIHCTLVSFLAGMNPLGVGLGLEGGNCSKAEINPIMVLVLPVPIICYLDKKQTK